MFVRQIVLRTFFFLFFFYFYRLHAIIQIVIYVPSIYHLIARTKDKLLTNWISFFFVFHFFLPLPFIFIEAKLFFLFFRSIVIYIPYLFPSLTEFFSFFLSLSSEKHIHFLNLWAWKSLYKVKVNVIVLSCQWYFPIYRFHFQFSSYLFIYFVLLLFVL